MSPLKIGTRDVTAVKIGSRDVIRIMHGTREVWAAEGGGGVEPFYLFTPTGSHSFSSTDDQHGWAFSLDSDATAIAARVFVNSTAEETVRLWRATGATLIASVAITPVANEWTEVEFASPVQLEAGVEYRVTTRRTNGASRSTRPLPLGGVEFSAGVTYLGGKRSTGDGYPSGSLSDSVWGAVNLVVQ